MFWRLEIVTQNKGSTGSSMLLGMRGEKEKKEKLLSFSSFLKLNVSYEKVKISPRSKCIICCQVLACHDSQVRLSPTAHSDFSSSILFCREALSTPNPPTAITVPRHIEFPHQPLSRLCTDAWPSTIKCIQILSGKA